MSTGSLELLVLVPTLIELIVSTCSPNEVAREQEYGKFYEEQAGELLIKFGYTV